MAVAKDIHAAVFRNATALFMARVENATGTVITQSSTSSIRYSVYELDADDPDSFVVVVGHDNVTLDVAEVIFDALQNDEAWTIDTTGYNFRHELDVSQNEAFSQAGRLYQVRYELTPGDGQKIVFRFKVRCI